MARLISLLCVLLLASPSLAQRPLLIPFQGLLTDSAGTPLPNGSVPMHFALYQQAEQGSDVWNEDQTVDIVSGIVSIYLGINTPIPPELFDSQLWLGITVDVDDEMSPRTILGVSPYAAALYDTTSGGSGAANGEVCATGEECTSGFCTDGVCCEAACDGSCQQCDGAVAGVCETYAAGTDPDNACGAFYCSGSASCETLCESSGECKTFAYCTSGLVCETKQPNGSACVLGVECQSGDCADGYCCNSPCSGTCQSCDQIGYLGACMLDGPGTDPDNECGAYFCSGSGLCESTCTTVADCKFGYDCVEGTCVTV